MTDLVIEGFTDREFTAAELSALLVTMPNMYDAVTRFGIFGDPVPLSTTFFALDIYNGVLNLLPTTERGGPATKGSVGKRSKKIFEVPHIAHEDLITAADLQNVARFGSRAPMMLEDLMGQKLQTMSMKHYLTHEWFRVGALKGQILDADGTVLLNLFTEFGITEKVEFFGAAGSKAQHCRNIWRHMETNLKGETMAGIAALCSSGFMDMLLEDADVKAAYNAASAMLVANPNIYDTRRAFPYQNILFMEYLGQADRLNADGTTTTLKFIPDNEARFFPIGTLDSAHFVCAPADFLEAANMPAQLMYAKAEPLKFNRGLEIHTQSSPLPIWKRPALLVKGSTAAS